MFQRKTPENQIKFVTEAFYVGESIDLKKVQESIKQYPFLNRDHPLVLKFLKDKYIVLTKFGVVSFWNIAERQQKQFLRELVPFIRAKKEYYPYKERVRIIIKEGERADYVSPQKISLSTLDINRIKIISYVISQSVALERYEDDIETHLNELENVIENLKSTGRALLKERELLKQVGRVLSVKQNAVSHLSLFDKPEEVWESPELESLYNKMNVEFDLQVRFSVLDKKIDFLSENSRMLMEFMAEKKNAFLEFIIIILILIEMIPLAVDFVGYLLKSF